jgi:hypothetical protein
MQPAFILLLSHLNTAKILRNNLLLEFCIEEVVNLSILRFGLFKNALSPACIITFSIQKPNDNESITYICPKSSSSSNEDDYYIEIEPQDVNEIYLQEAISDSLVWTVFMWGGRAGFELDEVLSYNMKI